MNIFRFFSILISVVLLIWLAACSSSQTTGGEGVGNGSSESSADAVGSIPEDMLDTAESDDPTELKDPEATEPSGDASVKNEESAKSTAEASEDTADPFADLRDAENSSATEVSMHSDSDTTKSSGELATYTVKKGDTLMKIAFSIYGDVDRWKDLFDLNRDKISSVAKLRAGMHLKYEAPLEQFSPSDLSNSYLIKQGDTLAGIADEVYGRKSKYRKLQNYNQALIKNPNRIFAGFTIFYDITPQEIAEAEARRKERSGASVGGGGLSETASSLIPDSSTAPSTPSVISPAEKSTAESAPIAVSPDSSTVISPPTN